MALSLGLCEIVNSMVKHYQFTPIFSTLKDVPDEWVRLLSVIVQAHVRHTPVSDNLEEICNLLPLWQCFTHQKW